MAKVYVKLYDNFKLSGTDFAQTMSNHLRRVVFSPDGIHSISIVSLKDGAMLITNETEAEFDFSISRNRRVLAVIRYRKGENSLRINNNWMLTQDQVLNRAVNQNPDLLFSPHFNIDFEGTKMARVDLKINESPMAGAFFTERDLLFMRMNGNYAYPRLCEQIQKEASDLPITEEQAVAYLTQNDDILARFPPTEAQVLAFLDDHPDVAANLPVNEVQVSAFLNNNSEFAKIFQKHWFARLMQTTQSVAFKLIFSYSTFIDLTSKRIKNVSNFEI